MKRDLSKFAALTAGEKRTLIGAVLLLPLAELGLRVFGYDRTQRALMRSTADRKPSPLVPAERFAEAGRVAYCVRIAARRGPCRATCLRESLVTCWLLRRRGIRATLTIGVGKDAGEFQAHAWVELDGVPVIDRPETQQAYSTIHQAGGKGASAPGG